MADEDAKKDDDQQQGAPEADKAEDKKEAEEKKDEKPSKDYSKEVTQIVEQVEKMTVLEVADLVSAIEDKFGVSAAPVAVAGAAPAGGDGGGDGGEDEKSSYTIHLASMGDKKIDVIKAVREVTDLGLGEAKELVESA
ncbi:MAG: 50S ribosomal protein L7/L12, partial [Patescibacteria group bacterium]